MKTQTEIKMDECDTIEKIVSQLKWCNYGNEAGFLNMNVAFLALERMAKSNKEIRCPFCGTDGFDKIGLKYHLDNYCDVFAKL